MIIDMFKYVTFKNLTEMKCIFLLLLKRYLFIFVYVF